MKTLNLKNKLFSVTLLLSTAMIGQSAFAGVPSIGITHSPGINKTQANQKSRINQGVRSGSLTVKEAKVLRKQQAKINLKKRHFKADRRFTPREREIIRKDLRKLSKRIYAKKHNAQKRRVNRSHWHSQDQSRWNGYPNVRHTPGINQRQRNQKSRIKQGLRSGSLTIHEAARLGIQYANIEEQERRFRADGRFTQHERRIINNRLKRASKNIHRKKHNWKHR